MADEDLGLKVENVVDWFREYKHPLNVPLVVHTKDGPKPVVGFQIDYRTGAIILDANL